MKKSPKRSKRGTNKRSKGKLLKDVTTKKYTKSRKPIRKLNSDKRSKRRNSKTEKNIIRKLGCKQIDFVGQRRHSDKRDSLIATEVMRKVASPLKKGEVSFTKFCKLKKWCDNCEFKNKSCITSKIPHIDMVSKTQKQWVFGRMSNLPEYYSCPQYFYTLDSKDWDTLYQINDIFVYCAYKEGENQNFPIRIVTALDGGISSDDKKYGVKNYSDNLLTIPHLLGQKDSIDILARELCQIAKYFKLYMFQSIKHPHIFFASKKSPKRLEKELKKHELRHVMIE